MMKEKYYKDRSTFLSMFMILFLTGIIVGSLYSLRSLADLELSVLEQKIVPNEFEVKLLITSGILYGFFINMIIIGVAFIYLEIARIIPINIRFIGELSMRELLLRVALCIASILIIMCLKDVIVATLNADLSQDVQNWNLNMAFYIHNKAKEFYIIGVASAIALAVMFDNIRNISRIRNYLVIGRKSR